MSKVDGMTIHTTLEMYRWYVKQMLLKDKGLYTEYDKVIRRKGIYVLLRRGVSGSSGVHMTYTWFRAILEKANTKAKEAIIRGQAYNLGRYLGILMARRIERDFRKPTIDFAATDKYMKENPNSPKLWVYKTDEDYCRVGWDKPSLRIANIIVYEFKPSVEFKKKFSLANAKNDILKHSYKFYPLNKR